MSTPRLRIPLYYDFASTLCYVAHRVFERLTPDLDELGLDLEWLPIDLAGLLNWERGAPVSASRLDNARRVARELKVPVRTPQRWIDSRPALSVALQLDDPGRAASWRELVFTSVFEHGLADELCDRTLELAEQQGLRPAPDALEAGLHELEQCTRAAAEASVSGAPTLMLRGFPIGGIQADQTMLNMLRRYANRVRGDMANHGTLH